MLELALQILLRHRFVFRMRLCRLGVCAERTSTTGSTSPVGRTSCSIIWPACCFSYSAGVADTKIVCGSTFSNSSKCNGLLSSAGGCRTRGITVGDYIEGKTVLLSLYIVIYGPRIQIVEIEFSSAESSLY